MHTLATQAAHRIVYTHQSSFGKTAAEASTAPNIDVNFTRCVAAEADGSGWEDLHEGSHTMTYDTSKVPGAR